MMNPNLKNQIQLREPNEIEFKKVAQFSFENFVIESAKSTGKTLEELKSYLGNTPDQIYENDIWRIIEFNDKEIGFLWVKLDFKTLSGFGYDIYLEPEFRSKGIGRIVMNQVGIEIKEKGYQSISICVFEKNLIARSLYESMGFKVVKFDDDRKQFTLNILLSNLEFI